MNMRRYAAKYERMGLVTRLFEDTDSARRWLEARGSVER
jgi:hypothetical protein